MFPMIRDSLFPMWSVAEIMTFVGSIFNCVTIFAATFLVGLRDA